MNRWDRLILALMRQGHDEDALKIFQLNIEFYPNSCNTYDSYGDALLKLDRKEEAIKAYKKSLELNPGNEKARMILKSWNIVFLKKYLNKVTSPIGNR